MCPPLNGRVDLRSDTVTQPSAAMRDAIADAPVGDDVLGDDPTVQMLQERLAAMLGKDAALFVPSGTMANAVSVRTHTTPGDEIVTEGTSHVYVYEGGGYAALSGCSVALVEAKRGIMAPTDVAAAIRKSKMPQAPAPTASLSDELHKLGELRQQGVLSEAEFQAAKQKLIG